MELEKENNQEQKSASELRFDLVSKDWVVIATGRSKRPENFAKQERRKEESNKDDCPFCHLETIGKILLEYRDKEGQWSVAVIPNKFPAFSFSHSLHERAEGPYSVMDGVGYHEVVITHDHDRHLSDLPVETVRQVIDAYQERYLDLANEKLVNYVSVFHNHGLEAGASLAHPHSQIIALPVIDPDLNRSLSGSRQFFEVHKKCVHCTMLEWDREDGRRIIYENEEFVVLVPFASRVAFEMRIYPKAHHAYFERIKDDEKNLLADALKVALGKIKKGLNDPAYNFFIHTAPADGKDYGHYHWHLEILPKTSTWAGFELGTGIQISTVEPEIAAEYLRKIT
ncbi:MAG: Galactose-1-phosphate uridylyltransferase [Parcubacteria group bacterium GW2011_GWC2_42_6]|nr:MAG: Galactose-1-phosphate uridylyltransferase [Parcubacteria group bacterium GW2011_GWA2_42_11]KKS68444.1 MAG: Galactose-1-phosphate uridylyltransferase [Parcubacteria group bacterium GW2011_GWC2_42_6]KKT76523.1 MAG: Galactose-1-phosphate uridylyltransferase [Parcubacteria group bacterium GW2011_GWF2_44_7]